MVQLTSKNLPNILITGALGQIGSELTAALRNKYGDGSVLATDIRTNDSDSGMFELLNVMDRQRMSELVEKYQINQIYHLAAILSATGEKNPIGTWDLNMQSWLNVLEVAREYKIEQVFFPSSIAVYGPSAEKDPAPQDCLLDPSTVYGISKVAGEIWSKYYAERYDLDIRSLRFPGLISHGTSPGGGTTDYAVEIFHDAIVGKKYNCFLKKDTRLPMLYMEDAVQGILLLMDTPKENLQKGKSYNLGGLAFTPEELAQAIQKEIPNFEISYEPDHRQSIAESWPNRVDDRQSAEDWKWQPKFTLENMVQTMILNLRKKNLLTASNI